jgi:hypothetical protein
MRLPADAQLATVALLYAARRITARLLAEYGLFSIAHWKALHEPRLLTAVPVFYSAAVGMQFHGSSAS